MKLACITIDLESDYGYNYIDSYGAFEDTGALESILDKYGIAPTAFITKGVLERPLSFVKKLEEQKAQFELHIVTHFPKEKRIKEMIRTKEAYIKRFGKPPLGYRGPAGLISEQELMILAREGFKFDSSIFPFRRPGFFDNSMMPQRPFIYEDSGLIEIPFSVIPKVRLPFSISYIQLFRSASYRLLEGIFGLPELLIFNLHLHDLFSSRAIKRLPLRWRMIYRWNYLSRPLGILEDYIIRLKDQGYRFVSMKEIYEAALNKTIRCEILGKEIWEKWRSRN
ncbi:polysaccharide deacetylase family protein [bacterium]|nr:polysaccharide deacetylase family protein [bacterium]